MPQPPCKLDYARPESPKPAMSGSVTGWACFFFAGLISVAVCPLVLNAIDRRENPHSRRMDAPPDIFIAMLFILLLFLYLGSLFAHRHPTPLIAFTVGLIPLLFFLGLLALG